MGAMAFPSNPSDGQQYDKWYYDAASAEWKLVASLKDPLWKDNEDGTIHYPDGNVGIGTDAPGHPLHVVGNARFQKPGLGGLTVNIQDGTESGTGNSRAGLHLHNSEADMFIGSIPSEGMGSYTPNLNLNSGTFTVQTKGTDRLTIDNNGLVTFSGTVNAQKMQSQFFLKSDGSEGLFIGSGVIYPGNSAGAVDDSISLGDSGYRFKDAYFSGAVDASGMRIGGNLIYNNSATGHGIRFNTVEDNILPVDNTGNLRSVGASLGNVSRKFKDAHFSGTVNSTALALGNWKIELDGNNLAFKYNGTKVFKLETTGKVISKNDVQAFGTP